MKKLLKQTLVYLLSIVIVITTSANAYAISAGWSVQTASMIGANVMVEAVKNNAKSLVKIAPSSSSLGKLLLKGAGAGALAYAISKALDATDYVLDPANNAIRFKTTGDGWEYRIDGKGFTTVEQACKHIWSDSYLSNTYGYKQTRLSNGNNRGKYYNAIKWSNPWSFTCYVNVGYVDFDYKGNIGGWIMSVSGNKYATGKIDERTISADAVAQMVIANASNGHTQSQQAVVDSVKADVRAGVHDNALQANAVPINGADGVDGVNGVDGTNGKDGADAPPFDPSSIINALSSLANRISASFSRLETKADAIVQEQQDIKRVINTATDTIIDVERETQARISDVVGAVDTVGSKVDTQGRLINDNIDKVIDEVKVIPDVINTSTDAITTAIEGMELGLDDRVINDAVDRVIEGQQTQTDAIADAIKDNTDKIIESDKANTKEIADRLDKVDEFLQSKDYAPDPDPDSDVDVDTITPDRSASDFDTSYISYGGQCPTNPSKTINISGQTIDLTIDLKPMCDFASSVRPAVIALAYLAGMAIVASAIRDT